MMKCEWESLTIRNELRERRNSLYYFIIILCRRRLEQCDFEMITKKIMKLAGRWIENSDGNCQTGTVSEGVKSVVKTLRIDRDQQRHTELQLAIIFHRLFHLPRGFDNKRDSLFEEIATWFDARKLWWRWSSVTCGRFFCAFFWGKISPLSLSRSAAQLPPNCMQSLQSNKLSDYESGQLLSNLVGSKQNLH